MYADVTTGSMRSALAEMDRRRELQQTYNRIHGITPASIVKGIDDVLSSVYERDYVTVPLGQDSGETFRTVEEREAHVEKLEAEMRDAASNLAFEHAASLRDRIQRVREQDLGITK